MANVKQKTPKTKKPPATDSRGARHSSATAEHYSPEAYVEASRRLMRTIDLDPASCAKANEVVKAMRYFTKEDDGLAQEWHGTAFINPPGAEKAWDATQGKMITVSPSLVRPFWCKLVAEYIAGRVEQAVWLGFSLEQLQTLQSAPGHSPLDFPLCYPRKRIAFLGVDLVPQKGPTHVNYVAFLPPRHETERAIADFKALFTPVGKVVTELSFRRPALDVDPRQLHLSVVK